MWVRRAGKASAQSVGDGPQHRAVINGEYQKSEANAGATDEPKSFLIAADNNSY